MICFTKAVGGKKKPKLIFCANACLVYTIMSAVLLFLFFVLDKVMWVKFPKFLCVSTENIVLDGSTLPSRGEEDNHILIRNRNIFVLIITSTTYTDINCDVISLLIYEVACISGHADTE